jgi:hypothetical protein
MGLETKTNENDTLLWFFTISITCSTKKGTQHEQTIGSFIHTEQTKDVKRSI